MRTLTLMANYWLFITETEAEAEVETEAEAETEAEIETQTKIETDLQGWALGNLEQQPQSLVHRSIRWQGFGDVGIQAY